MKIYYGEVSNQDILDFGTDGLVENDGNYYNGYVEFGSNPGGLDDVVIADGCGRAIPVSVRDLFALCTALSEISNISDEIHQADRLKEYAESSEETAYVCEQGHLHY